MSQLPWNNFDEYKKWQESNCDECAATQSDGTPKRGAMAFRLGYPLCGFNSRIVDGFATQDDEYVKAWASEIGWEEACGDGWICELKEEGV